MRENQIPEKQVTFRSGDLTLEGLLASRDSEAPAAVVCHPHPMYGGSMHNNAVEAILAAMWQLGYATLRFNFRGVGASEGEHDGGPGEVDDAVAAMTFLLAQPGVRKDGADEVWKGDEVLSCHFNTPVVKDGFLYGIDH